MNDETALDTVLAPLLLALPGRATPSGLLAQIEGEIDRTGRHRPRPKVFRRAVRGGVPFSMGLTLGAAAMAALVLTTAPPWLKRTPDPVRIASMSGTPGAAILETHQAGEHLYLIVDYQSAVPVADGALELWSIPAKGDGPRSLAVLAPKDRLTVVPMSEPFEVGDAFALSLEPYGGSPEAGPTGPVLMNTVLEQDD